MSVIRAHFDGKVFVPEEPVDVPKGTPVRLFLVQEGNGDRPLAELARLTESLSAEADWPADGAAEHDHSLYGTPKRNP